MVSLLAYQFEALYTLTDMLKSRGIIEDDDMHAFWSIRPLEARKESTEKAHQIYATLAEAVGINPEEVGIGPSQQ